MCNDYIKSILWTDINAKRSRLNCCHVINNRIINEFPNKFNHDEGNTEKAQ